MSERKEAPLAAPAAADDNAIMAERRAKLAALRAAGQAFPNDFRRDALAGDLHAKYDASSNEELEGLRVVASVAGSEPSGAAIGIAGGRAEDECT